MLGSRYIIAASPRSGVAWLAHNLTIPSQGMICLHRPRILREERRGEWLQPEWAAKGYPLLIEQTRATYRVVGDAGSWGPNVLAYALNNVLAPEPGTKVALLVRNGRHVVSSMGGDFRAACRAWADNLPAIKTMERDAPTIPFLSFRVEDLTADINPICQFLFGHPHPAPSLILRSPINRGPADDAWTPDQEAMFADICGEAMQAFGY